MRLVDETEMRWVSGGLCSLGHYDSDEIDPAMLAWTTYSGFAAIDANWLATHNSSDSLWQYYTDLYAQDKSDADSWGVELSTYIEENNAWVWNNCGHVFINNPITT